VTALALPLWAGTTTLSFEGLQDGQSIGNYYNGGAGGSYGIAFTVDATAFIQTLIPVPNQGGGYPNPNDCCYTSGGSGFFGGEPSAVTAMMFCDDNNSAPCNTQISPETIDVAGGFNTGFSLYYSAPFSGGELDIWSGPDGSGTDLGTLLLPETAAYDSSGDGNCDEYGAASDPGVPACPFVDASISFSGTAGSVVFTGATDAMFFDDMTFDALGPSSAPEPATWLLIGAGLAGIAFYRLSH
jgi:hypothetical protein